MSDAGSDQEYEYEEMEYEDEGFGGVELHESSFTEESYDAEDLGNYKCLTKESLEQKQEAEFSKLSEVLNKDLWSIGVLLRHYRWNVDGIIADYLEDPERVCQKVGLSLEDDFSIEKKANVHCGICLETKSECTGLRCKHYFCSDCWLEYLNFKILVEGATSTRIMCAQPSCNILIDETFIKAFVTPDVYTKLRGFMFRSLVDDNPSLKWCTRPGCENVVCKSNAPFFSAAICDCGQRFCFRCTQDAHSPIDCEMMKHWTTKCQDDSETYSWLIVNTKPCPKCLCPIDKNGGCNHMTCVKCRYEFCWVCNGDWKDHGTQYYNCNRFDPNKQGKSNVDTSKKSLEKYLHYYVRFTNHASSLKLEQQMMKKMEQKINQLIQDGQISWIDLQYISIAANQLSECRRILQYSYVFAYYKEDGPSKMLFENLQEGLERTTEYLSELWETNDVSHEATHKPLIISETRKAHNMVQNLLKGVKTGQAS